jgi:hypothetical protein
LEDRVQDALFHAFTMANGVHAECIRNDGDETDPLPDYSMDEPIGETNAPDASENDTFDPHALEEAIRPFYRGAKCTQLAATILLMNLCTVHGVTNGFADELFTILNSHLPPTENVLPKNYYAARSLTAKLGLSYNSIHAYDKGCVLFRGEHAEVVQCPKCGSPKYIDEIRKKVPVKVLRYFPNIPRLQPMFRSPSISKFLVVAFREQEQPGRRG